MNTELIVREVKTLFPAAQDIEVYWEDGESYSIMGDTPVSEAFGDYVVESVRALSADRYSIFLKKRGAYKRAEACSLLSESTPQ